MFETEFLRWFRHLRLDYMLFRVIFFCCFRKNKGNVGLSSLHTEQFNRPVPSSRGEKDLPASDD